MGRLYRAASFSVQRNLYAASFSAAWLSCAFGQESPVCHGIGGQEQVCEDFTYAGSLVEDLPPSGQLHEVLGVQTQLLDVPGPEQGLEHCGERITTWLEKAAEYYRTGVYHAEDIVPTQNYIMGNHDEIAERCPAAWLVTLVLKIESNLEHGRQGLTCARVHAAGCLRDARGYWQMYADTRAQFAGGGGGPKHIFDLLLAGEARISNSFRQSLSSAGSDEL